MAELEAVHEWSARTKDGDLSISAVVTDDSGIAPHVTSTADNCLGQKCDFYNECHVVRARRAAQERNWHEHRNQDRGRGDDGKEHLAGADDGGGVVGHGFCEHGRNKIKC